MKLLSLLITVVTISGLSANDGQFCKLVKSCKVLDAADLKKIGERMDKIEADLKMVKKAVLPKPSSTYVVSSTTKSWYNARRDCLSKKGDLVSITSDLEQKTLERQLKGDSTVGGAWFWIGLNDRQTESNFVWSDGSVKQFENWRSGEPNNFNSYNEDCVEIHKSNNWQWNDYTCSTPLRYICEIPAKAE